jgi:hypothetical protein
MKKEVGVAVMATILVLQLLGNFIGGTFGKIADSIAEQLTHRIQIEQMLSGEYR